MSRHPRISTQSAQSRRAAHLRGEPHELDVLGQIRAQGVGRRAQDVRPPGPGLERPRERVKTAATQ